MAIKEFALGSWEGNGDFGLSENSLKNLNFCCQAHSPKIGFSLSGEFDFRTMELKTDIHKLSCDLTEHCLHLQPPLTLTIKQDYVDHGSATSGRVRQAILKMHKIIVADLRNV